MKREHALILTSTGPALMERVFWYRRMIELIGDEAPETCAYLEMQAKRLEESIIEIARASEQMNSSKTFPKR